MMMMENRKKDLAHPMRQEKNPKKSHQALRLCAAGLLREDQLRQNTGGPTVVNGIIRRCETRVVSSETNEQRNSCWVNREYMYISRAIINHAVERPPAPERQELL
ncbi:hypothetical protein OUZ56_013487 [Daphnia magna]|uniref:Uncharacterized protein n=1 Tax=Daphnia magna TaxID=35525 RepID=A0ABQ9Z643_9CRUS|nr:hypothetical protein OUZ56_013487 [Daphnia magna]